MASASEVLFLPPDGGRCYDAGPMRAVFKADGEETGDAYCVSEWWLEAGDDGPGPHSHEKNVEIFYVVEGVMSFLAGEEWLEAHRGSFLRIPAGVTHDFANRSDARAGALNVFMPGGFEPMMEKIVAWYAEQGYTPRPEACASPAATGGDPACAESPPRCFSRRAACPSPTAT